MKIIRYWNTHAVFKKVLFISFVLIAGCVTNQYTESPVFDARYQKDIDNRSIPVPEEHETGRIWDRTYNLFARQMYRAVYIPGWGSTFAEALNVKEPKPAENVNAWDEVPDSSWFTNRIGRRQISIEEIKKGPRKNSGPDMSGPWKVIKGKISGIAPGFVIKDARGDIYFIKFNSPGYEGLTSGAEIISTLILHAAGYNVPENHVMNVPLSIFTIGEKATTKDKYGVKKRMAKDDFDNVIKRTNTDREGKVRVIASKGLSGKPLGGFFFEGIRKDDPNDRIRHEHRRELRGYRLFSAWLNNTDVHVHNTLDMYQGGDGEGYVRHYMIDFGTSLGSAGGLPKNPAIGYEYLIDYGAIGKNLISLGFNEPDWVSNNHSGYSSVGIFESENFDPVKWRNAYPARAFELMDDRDAFWAAKIIMSFTDEMLRAVVSEVRYPEQGAAEHVLKTLIERRDKIGQEWFGRVTPIDGFQVNRDQLVFNDLAIDSGLTAMNGRTYIYTVWQEDRSGKNIIINEHRESNDRAVSIVSASENIKNPYMTVRIEIEDNGVSVGRGVYVYLYCGDQRSCRVTGLDRR
jgi:hypothetical protein